MQKGKPYSKAIFKGKLARLCPLHMAVWEMKGLRLSYDSALKVHAVCLLHITMDKNEHRERNHSLPTATVLLTGASPKHSPAKRKCWHRTRTDRTKQSQFCTGSLSGTFTHAQPFVLSPHRPLSSLWGPHQIVLHLYRVGHSWSGNKHSCDMTEEKNTQGKPKHTILHEHQATMSLQEQLWERSLQEQQAPFKIPIKLNSNSWEWLSPSP